MKRNFSPYFLLALLVFVLASCSKKVNVPVPADAAVVVHISGSSLSSKLSWDEFKQGELYKVASENINDSLGKQILDNPESSGIDIKSDAFLFVRNRGNGAYTGFTCAIKDEKAFTEMVRKVTHDEITKQGSLSVIKDHSSVMTWNSSRFVFIGDSPEINGAGGFGKSFSSGNRRFDEDSLFKFASEVYDIKGSDGIGSNEKFASMMKTTGDMHFWLNPGKLYGGSLGSMMALTKASLLFDGNYTAATLNFDNGKIAVDGKSYYNKELGALYKKYSMNNLSEDMLKKIPSNNVAAVIAMNYPPEGLKEFMALLGVDGLVNAFLADMGYSIDDFIKANKGDILLSVSDFGFVKKEVKYKMGDQEYSYPSTTPEAKILFATSVKDKASFEKMITLVTEKINEQGSAVTDIASKIPFSLKDDWFVAGNDSAMVHSYGNGSTNQPFISKISGHPFGGFADIQKFINGARPSMESDSIALQIADQSAKFWQDLVFYGGEFRNEATESHLEINMVDKTTNSLKQLNTYLGSIAKIVNDREKRQKAMWESNATDSAPMVVPEVVAPGK